jgi:hypothetical protein
MKRVIAVIALVCAFIPASQANQNSGDKPRATKTEAAQSPATLGDGVRQLGHEIMAASHKARRVVLTRCADGRHTVKGHAACAGHGGVSAQN